MTKLNLNADMGESFGAFKMGNDAELVRSVQSANIACGFHGGDPLVIQRCIQACLDNNVSLGAHPSFYDLHGFGRREMELSKAELEALLLYQIGALQSLAQAQGARVSHIKPHGALNNMACRDLDLARLIAQTLQKMDQGFILLAPALSKLAQAGHESGLKVVQEIYADRAYEEDATLVSRKKPGAVLHDPQEALAHVKQILEKGAIISQSGKVLPCKIESICVHGDNPDATKTARLLSQKLESSGYHLVGLDRF